MLSTGSNATATGFSNAFSPTLARLLTAPERNFALSSALSTNNATNSNNNKFFSNQGINMTKTSNLQSQKQQQQDTKPEISCLPISQILAFQQQQQQLQNNSLLQQQLQRHQRDINKLLPKNSILFNLVRNSKRKKKKEKN